MYNLGNEIITQINFKVQEIFSWSHNPLFLKPNGVIEVVANFFCCLSVRFKLFFPILDLPQTVLASSYALTAQRPFFLLTLIESFQQFYENRKEAWRNVLIDPIPSCRWFGFQDTGPKINTSSKNRIISLWVIIIFKCCILGTKFRTVQIIAPLARAICSRDRTEAHLEFHTHR